MRVLHRVSSELNLDLGDKDFVNLVYAIEALPGIKITCADKFDGVWIFFSVDVTEQGLFFLTRCIDKRYSSGEWSITLSVGDIIGDNGELPVVYLLSTGRNCKNISKKIIELYNMLNFYITHENFINYYKIDLDKFDIVDIISIERDMKIDDILDKK